MKQIARFIMLLTLSVTIGPAVRADVCVYSPPKVRQVQGNVVDSTGQPIPGVSVIATRNGKNLGTSKTNGAGEFTFGLLDKGEYELHFAASGFKPAEYKLFLTRPSKHWNRSLRIVLVVGAVHCNGSISVVKRTTEQNR